jgi:hypothetical protein
MGANQSKPPKHKQTKNTRKVQVTTHSHRLSRSMKLNNNISKKLYGDKKLQSKKVEGYEGEFYGIISEKNTGHAITEDTFEPEDDYYTINEKLKSHCEEYRKANFTEEENKELDDSQSIYEFRCGFGGDDQNGVINFFVPKQIPLPSKMKFMINNIAYIMRFKFR